MEIFSAQNEFLSLGVKDFGAELTSLTLKSNGREYVWQGNPDIWYGQAPILFPFIGRLLNDTYRVNGQEYTCPKHGLARKRAFTLKERTSSSLVFVQTEDEDSLKMYPYRYELIVVFTLIGDVLRVEHTIKNTNDTVMYFSIGAHPGFNCAIGDILEFDTVQTLSTERIDENAFLIDEKFPLLCNQKQLTITDTIFDKDALILSGYTDSAVTLKGKDYALRFRFFDAPVLGIWAKPKAPYVCLEPWFGVNDGYDKKADISQKRGILSLRPKESFSLTYEVQPLQRNNS